VLDPRGAPLRAFGESFPPFERPAPGTEDQVRRRRDDARRALDVEWPGDAGDLGIAARLDLSTADADLASYVLNILALVLVVSGFVTVGVLLDPSAGGAK